MSNNFEPTEPMPQNQPRQNPQPTQPMPQNTGYAQQYEYGSQFQQPQQPGQPQQPMQQGPAQEQNLQQNPQQNQARPVAPGWMKQKQYVTGPGMSTKSKIVAGLLAIFFGAFGVHNFYLGNTGKAVGQLLLTIFGAFVLVGPLISEIWAIVEGIYILASHPGSKWHVDANNLQLQD